MPETGNRGSEKGLALVSVLWALSILSLIAAAVLSASVLAYRMERNAWRQTQARMIVEAAVNRAVLGLLDQRPGKRWSADGSPQDFIFEGTSVRVSITDELGKIDLNAASDDLLRALFRNVVASPEAADRLTDNVLDWRSSTGLRHLNGTGEAERGAGDSPRYGPFQSVDELKLVPGVTPSLFAKLAPALTVYSHRPTVDPQRAPSLVLRALPGMDARRAADIVAARGTPDISSSGINGSPSGFVDASIPVVGHAFSITVAFRYADRPMSETAVVRLTGNPTEPYWLLARD